jgi:hypothetical protein
MNRKLFLICVIVLLALCSTAWAADVNGKWVAKVAGTQGQQDYEITLTFKAEGTTLTGTLNNSSMPGDVAINDGKIEGDNISFSIIRNMGQSDMKIVWKGTASGDEIKFTRGVEGGQGGAGAGATTEITAKRAK